MKINIENLKAQLQGRDLNVYQKADALSEFNKLLDYIEELEGGKKMVSCKNCDKDDMMLTCSKCNKVLIEPKNK